MNKVYLLDTNFISELSKITPDESVLKAYAVRKDVCAMASVTWQELVYGVSRLPESNRKKALSSFIQQVRENIEIIPYDDFAADICGNLLSASEKTGRPLPYCDAQIAATAISRGMVLVTRNTDDFSDLTRTAFLRMENWFQGRR